jgi:CHAT domain
MKSWRERKWFSPLVFLAACTLLGACGKAEEPPPPQATVRSPPPVYNADISPQYPRDKAAPNRPVLQPGQLTTLRFGIGPKWDSSVLPDVTPSREILESKQNLPLTVILFCGFCDPHAESVKRMTYMPGQSRSDEIRFQFTPRRQEDGSAYVDKLQLGIVNDATGRDYDRLVIDVVVSGTAGVSGPTATGTTIAVKTIPPTIPPNMLGLTGSAGADVILYAEAENGRNIKISVQPVSDEMKRRLNLALDAEGNRREFRSGIDDAKLVEAMTNTAYGVMSAVSMQGEFLNRLSATGRYAAVSPDSQKSLELNDAELKSVTSVIAEIGQRLYRHLFYSTSDTDLRKLVVALEAAAADPQRERPLRLKINSNSISLPWQYLHPVGPDVDAKKFWGFRFSLSVGRVNTGARAGPKAPQEQKPRKVVFARYQSSLDQTVSLAKEQKQQLNKLPIADDNLLEVDSGSALLASLKQQRRQISAIFTFLHAKSMTSDSEPHLMFNDGDIVTSDLLEDLLNKVPPEEQDSRYLASGPLVILNACETGPSVNLPHVSLQNAMFQLGAQAVVVTEVSVWVALGHDMATRLIKRLGKGEPIGDALTASRWELYKEKYNPLGLLYVYYGDPEATLRY